MQMQGLLAERSSALSMLPCCRSRVPPRVPYRGASEVMRSMAHTHRQSCRSPAPPTVCTAIGASSPHSTSHGVRAHRRAAHLPHHWMPRPPTALQISSVCSLRPYRFMFVSESLFTETRVVSKSGVPEVSPAAEEKVSFQVSGADFRVPLQANGAAKESTRREVIVEMLIDREATKEKMPRPYELSRGPFRRPVKAEPWKGINVQSENTPVLSEQLEPEELHIDMPAESFTPQFDPQKLHIDVARLPHGVQTQRTRPPRPPLNSSGS